VENDNKIIAVKGFNKDWTCRGYQFEIGKTYEHAGKVEACASGFHSVEYPLDVFGYYAPSCSVYAIVEVSGEISRHEDDTKIASAKISIKAELNLSELIDRAVKWIFARALPAEGAAQASGYQGAAQASGDQGAAQASGTRGAAQASGDQGAAQASGYQGAAQASGTRGAAQASGYQGAAQASGKYGVASGLGYKSKARGAETCAVVLVNRNDEGEIVHVFASKVGENGIEPDVWYTLDDSGNPIKVED
jgi:hypothetical protein